MVWRGSSDFDKQNNPHSTSEETSVGIRLGAKCVCSNYLIKNGKKERAVLQNCVGAELKPNAICQPVHIYSYSDRQISVANLRPEILLAGRHCMIILKKSRLLFFFSMKCILVLVKWPRSLGEDETDIYLVGLLGDTDRERVSKSRRKNILQHSCLPKLLDFFHYIK